MEDNNPKKNDDPTPSFLNGTYSFYTKLVVMVVLVFLASIGYFRSNLMDHDSLSPNAVVTTEENINAVGDDDEARLSGATQRKSIHDLDLVSETGEKTKLSSFKGKVVVLSFWATDCAPCLEELPTFAKLQKEFGTDKLVIIPVNIEDETSLDKNLVASIWKKNNLDFKTYYDSRQVNAEIMDIQIIPTNYILDKNGKIAFSSFGYNNWSSQKALQLVKALVDETN